MEKESKLIEGSVWVFNEDTSEYPSRYLLTWIGTVNCQIKKMDGEVVTMRIGDLLKDYHVLPEDEKTSPSIVELEKENHKPLGEIQYDRTCLDCIKGFDFEQMSKDKTCPYCGGINHAGVMIEKSKTLIEDEFVSYEGTDPANGSDSVGVNLLDTLNQKVVTTQDAIPNKYSERLGEMGRSQCEATFNRDREISGNHNPNGIFDYIEENVLLKDMRKTFEDCMQTAIAKNSDYGGSNNDPYANFRNSTIAGVPVEKGIMVRMMDKISRVSTLMEKEAQVKDEAIEDTLMDLINYAAILKSYLKNK